MSRGYAGVNGTFVPFNKNTVALFGDSITALAKSTTGIYTYHSSRGYWTWANALGLNHRLDVVAFAGVSGNTTTAMLARIQTDVIAYAPGWCVVAGGTNDVSSSATFATIQSNLTAIFDALDDAGIRVIACTIPPRNSLTAGQFLVQQQVNAWLHSIARTRPNFHLVDWTARVIDPSTSGSGAWASGMDTDGVHPSSQGAARMGKALVDVLDPLVPFADPISSTPGETANLVLNPLMAGTGGTVTAPVTGTAATSWQITRSGSAGLTAVGSRVACDDQVAGHWQQLSVTANSGDIARIQQEVSGSKYTTGDTVYAQGEFQIDDDFVPGTVCRFLLLASNSGFSGVIGAYDFYLDGSDTFPAENVPGGTFRLRTPAITLPGTTAHLFWIFEWNGLGTVRTRRCEIRKV